MAETNELVEFLQARYAESQEVEERLNLVAQQISELEEFGMSIEEIDRSREKDILASLGKGVYLPAQIKEKELFIGVGSGIFVKKKPHEATAVVKSQIEGLLKMREDLLERNEDLNEEMQELMKNIESGQSEKN